VKAYFDKRNRNVPKSQLANIPTLDPRAALFGPSAKPQTPAGKQDALIARFDEKGIEELPWQ